MFDDVVFQAEISKVGIKVKDSSGVVRRICKVTFAREFDTLVASNLGADAKTALKALESRGLKAVVIPMDRIVGSCLLEGIEDTATIPVLRGVKAKCKAGAKDDDLPTVRFEFEFDFNEAAWGFLGRNCLAYTKVTLTPAQQSLAFPGPGVGELS
jgi:hypothetical protein